MDSKYDGASQIPSSKIPNPICEKESHKVDFPTPWQPCKRHERKRCVATCNPRKSKQLCASSMFLSVIKITSKQRTIMVTRFQRLFCHPGKRRKLGNFRRWMHETPSGTFLRFSRELAINPNIFFILNFLKRTKLRCGGASPCHP